MLYTVDGKKGTVEIVFVYFLIFDFTIFFTKVRMELYMAECREAESPDGLIFNQCDETMSRGKYPSVHPINKSMF